MVYGLDDSHPKGIGRKVKKGGVMARKARSEILYDGCYAHVFSRSIEKRRIFKDQDDFRYFKQLLMKEKERCKFDVFHYCLMQTHFHMAVGVKRLDSFSKALQQIKWKYTRRYNEKNKRCGPLWRERFNSMLIEDERYMLACGKYIEQNPLKAGMVACMSDWEFSSARHYEGIMKDDLINSYEVSEIPEDIDLSDENEFMQGYLIGSGWFKYKITKGIV